jgi:2'-5' RNA ligase
MQPKANYLHLWAIVPPQPIEEQIDAIRKEFAANFRAEAALKPPVHITLYKPFSVPVPEVKKHIEKLRRWVATQPSFAIELKNFAFFENPKSPVAFIDVVEHPDLKALNTGITKETKQHFELVDRTRQTFHPHFTIGYRDVSPELFPEVKRAYSKRPFTATFDVKHISLFRHNGKKWELKHELPLADLEATQGSLW